MTLTSALGCTARTERMIGPSSGGWVVRCPPSRANAARTRRGCESGRGGESGGASGPRSVRTAAPACAPSSLIRAPPLDLAVVRALDLAVDLADRCHPV